MTNLTQRGANATSSATLPALPASTAADPQRRAFEEAVREWLEVRMGARGDRFERAVTFRDFEPQVDALETRLDALEAVSSSTNSDAVRSLQAQVNALQMAVRSLTSALQAEADKARFNTLASEKKLLAGKIDGLDAPLVTLTATSQVFVRAANGGATTPANIVITATTQNVDNPVYQWQIDGATVAGSSSTYTIAPFSTGTAKSIRCNVTGDGNVNVFDVMSVFSLQEGSDALAAGLENENQTIQSSYIGIPVAGSFPVVSRMVVARGAAFLAYPTVAFGVVSSTGIESAGTTPGASANVSINSQTGVISIGKITSNYASATFRATVGGATIDKVLTLNKSLNGGDGSSAQTLTLTATGFAFLYPDSNATTATAPDQIDFTAALQNITGTVSFSAVGYNASGVGVSTPVLTNVTATTCSLVKSQFANSTTVRYVRVTAQITGTGGVTLRDYVTVYRGDNGADSLQVVLSNEAHVLAANSAGTVTNYTGSGTTVRVFEGTNELVYNGVGVSPSTWAVSAVGSGISPSFPRSTGSYATYDPHSNMAALEATITYTVTGRTRNNNAFSFTKTQSFTRSDAATPGLNGTRTAVLNLYQWGSSTAPTLPSGTVTYTWATASFTPTTLGSWSQTQGAGTAGQTLWVARHVYADSLTTATSTFSWAGSAAQAVGAVGNNGATAQTLTLAANGYGFAFPDKNSLTATAPGSITFVANLQNVTGTVSWSATAYGADNAPVPGATPTLVGSGNTMSLSKENFALVFGAPNTAVKYVIVTASIAGANGTLSDFVSVYRADGGSDALQAYLTNEAHTLPANSGGAVYSYSNSGTDIHVFQGATELNYDGSGSSPGTYAVTASGANISPSFPSDMGVYARYGDHSGMLATTASITYTITGRNLSNVAFSFTKTQSFSRSQDGAQGTQGTPGTPGTPGASGTNAGFLEVYKWAASQPTQFWEFPSGTSTYTWATGAFTAPSNANGWSVVPGASIRGFTLWACSVRAYDVATATQTVVSWNTTTAYAVGYSGQDGTSGTRGSLIVSAYASPNFISSSSWSDLTANLVVYRTLQNNYSLGTYSGNPQDWLRIGDTVTESNGSTWSETKYWSGSTWVLPGTVISGNLLVGGTISGQVNLNITGYARLEGFSSYTVPNPANFGYQSLAVAVAANTSRASQIGTYSSAANAGGAGVVGENASSGPGIYGYGGTGVLGRTSGSGAGVQGEASASFGSGGVKGFSGGPGTYGLYGSSGFFGGTGVYADGTAGTALFVNGQTTATARITSTVSGDVPLVLPRVGAKPSPVAGGVALHNTYGLIVSDGSNWYAATSLIAVP